MRQLPKIVSGATTHETRHEMCLENHLMSDFSVEGYFTQNPPTSNELRRGAFSRVALCVRSSEGTFSLGPVSHLWSILVCARHGRQTAAPACVALRGRGCRISGLKPLGTHMVAQREIELNGKLWSIKEYVACVPDSFERFLVISGTQLLRVGRAVHEKLLRDYDERIANASVDPEYPEWLARTRDILASREVPKNGPLMSIVTPAYKTPPRFLRKMIESVLGQTYPNWELVIVNASPSDQAMREVFSEFSDERIKVIDFPENRGITGNTNYGLSFCTGEYVSFFDHDDVIEPNALAEFVREIVSREVRPGLLYCDEDNIDEEDCPSLPLFKPCYNEDFLLSNNYVIHWLTVRRDLLAVVTLSDSAVEGAQDYDLTFKITELGCDVVRIPHVLYHWRIHSGSTAGNPGSKSYAQDSGARAIELHLQREGIEGTVRRGKAYFTYETTFPLPNPAPGICAISLGGISSCTEQALRTFEAEHDAMTHIVQPVNGDQVTRLAVSSDAKLILICSKEHDVDYPCLREMVSRASQPGVFAVSPRVVRDDGLLDYAGMIVRPDGTLRHLCRLLPSEDGGYVGRTQRPYDALVLNPECVLVNRLALAKLPLVNHFETLRYSLSDAFIRAYEAGLRNVYLPYATARLNVSGSLFDDKVDASEQSDARMLLRLFPQLAFDDLSHNPNFDPRSGYYGLNWNYVQDFRP